MIEFQTVEKSLGAKAVIAPLTLSIDPEQTTVLLGPSGSGKSTLLRMIIGLIMPDTGSIYVQKWKLNPKNLQEIRRKIGYVIQEGGLFPHLSGFDNVSLLARHLGWPKSQAKKRALKLCELTRLSSDCLEAFPSELSGGQRQRLSLMRALMLDPAILLLDEPLGALDPVVRSELQKDLRHIFRALKKTVLLVTHDMHEAKTLGEQAIFMKDGRLLHHGPVEDLWQSPKHPFVANFFSAIA